MEGWWEGGGDLIHISSANITIHLRAALTSPNCKFHLLFEPLFTHLQNGRTGQDDF